MEIDRLSWFSGDVNALQLYETLTTVAHLWDDLVDGDKQITKGDINKLMAHLLVNLPSNLFYRKHFEILHPLILTSVISYIASVRLESSEDAHKLELAHVLRYSVHQVAIMMFAIIGGFDYAVDITAANMHVMVPESYSEFYREHMHDTK